MELTLVQTGFVLGFGAQGGVLKGRDLGSFDVFSIARCGWRGGSVGGISSPPVNRDCAGSVGRGTEPNVVQFGEPKTDIETKDSGQRIDNLILVCAPGKKYLR